MAAGKKSGSRSLWEETAALPEFPVLPGERETEVLVIGGGIAGILCAALVHRAGAECILVEEGRVCGGVTGKTTAKITALHGVLYDTLIRRQGVECAWVHWRANCEAIEEYARLSQGIDCGFERQDACLYSAVDEALMEREYRALERIGAEAEYLNHLSLPFSVAGAVRVGNQAQFHPLRFLRELVRGLEIYEHTKVECLEGTAAVTNRGVIRAKKIVVATHFPLIDRHGSYFLKLFQRRGYVLALRNAPLPAAMYLPAEGGGVSVRRWEDCLILEGGGRRTGKSGGGFAPLEEFAAAHYPQAETVCRWANQDCMSLDGLPYVGTYSAGTENLYVVTGFSGWGMSTAMASAMLLRDLLQGQENPWAEVVSPSRGILRPQLAVNGAQAASSMLRLTRPRCTHLGCALEWNPQEQTWECPCHGSRFSREGEVLSRPARRKLKHP